MKSLKIFLAFILMSLAVSVSAQNSTFRYTTVPGPDNTYAVPHKSNVSQAYASTISLVPGNYNSEYITYSIAPLSGNPTINIAKTGVYLGDEIDLMITAASAPRTVTWGSYTTPTTSTLVVSNTVPVVVHFKFNGSTWVQINIGTGSGDVADTARVTQLTDSSTAVTINSSVGIITTATLKTPVTNTFAFTVTNSKVLTTSAILATGEYTGTTATAPMVTVKSFAAGSFIVRVTVVGTAGTNLTGTIRIHYAIFNK